MSLPIAKGTWAADPNHTQISFIARHLGFTKIRGTFSKFSINVNVGETIDSSSLNANVDLASVDTGNEDRNNHLRSADFFGGSEEPTMTFESTAIAGTPENFTITGDLTINGKTLPVTFDAMFGGTVDDPQGNSKALFEATAEIDRTDWGIDWNVPVAGGLLVSERIKIELDIQLSSQS